MPTVTKKKRYHRPQLRRGPSVEEGTQTSTEGVESDVGVQVFLVSPIVSDRRLQAPAALRV